MPSWLRRPSACSRCACPCTLPLRTISTRCVLKSRSWHCSSSVDGVQLPSRLLPHCCRNTCNCSFYLAEDPQSTARCLLFCRRGHRMAERNCGHVSFPERFPLTCRSRNGTLFPRHFSTPPIFSAPKTFSASPLCSWGLGARRCDYEVSRHGRHLRCRGCSMARSAEQSAVSFFQDTTTAR